MAEGSPEFGGNRAGDGQELEAQTVTVKNCIFAAAIFARVYTLKIEILKYV
jgi:hypothetical protein